MREGWDLKTLADLFDIGSSKRVYESQWKNAGVPFYRAREIVKLSRDGYVDNELFIDEELYEEYAKKYGIPKCGDLMVTGVGTLGVCYIVRENDKFYFKDGNILWFKSKKGTNPFYVRYAFKSNYLRQQIENCNGATVGTFTIVRAKKTTIPVPPLAEQERIVAELDLLQGIIEKKKEQLKAYDQLAQSIFYTMFGDPVENERKWDISELNNVCDVRDGTHDTPKYHEEGYPLITSKNVVDGRIIFDNVNFISKEDFDNISKRSRVDDGDIIMPMIGTIGKPTIVVKDRDFAIKNVALIKFVPNTRVLNIFIQSIMASSSFDTYMKSRNKGGTQKFIALGDIRKLKVPVPPLSLQQEFAEKVEAIERQKALVQQSIDETQTMFDYTMDKYFG